MTFDVLPMTEAHVPGLWAALDAVARERRFLAMVEAPPIADLAKFVRANIAKNSSQFVAVTENRIVGWCDITPKERLTLRHTGIVGMGVIDGHRGKGMGKALLTAAMAAARAGGLKRIELSVRADNERAKRLYESVGFVTEGRCAKWMHVDGEYYDCYMMAVLY